MHLKNLKKHCYYDNNVVSKAPKRRSLDKYYSNGF
jgi:hypothetical protein